MQRIGPLIRKLREEKGYPLRKVAAFLDIDQAILSKMERGKRKISKEQVIKLARFFNYDEKELLLVFLSDRIIDEVGDDYLALDALRVAEGLIEYKALSVLDRDQIIGIIIKGMQRYPKIVNAWIYGSFARGQDEPGSDIDIAVKTDEGFSYFDLAEIQYQLEESLNRKVDLGFINSFKPRILENVKRDLIQVYERQKG
ncbi:nucleotidyltransferase domain-containing protein [Bacteroidota bacterium]